VIEAAGEDILVFNPPPSSYLYFPTPTWGPQKRFVLSEQEGFTVQDLNQLVYVEQLAFSSSDKSEVNHIPPFTFYTPLTERCGPGQASNKFSVSCQPIYTKHHDGSPMHLLQPITSDLRRF
jgi:hypothetical protein